MVTLMITAHVLFIACHLISGQGGLSCWFFGDIPEIGSGIESSEDVKPKIEAIPESVGPTLDELDFVVDAFGSPITDGE